VVVVVVGAVVVVVVVVGAGLTTGVALTGGVLAVV
jgi:hypothetical protein